MLTLDVRIFLLVVGEIEAQNYKVTVRDETPPPTAIH